MIAFSSNKHTVLAMAARRDVHDAARRGSPPRGVAWRGALAACMRRVAVRCAAAPCGAPQHQAAYAKQDTKQTSLFSEHVIKGLPKASS